MLNRKHAALAGHPSWDISSQCCTQEGDRERTRVLEATLRNEWLWPVDLCLLRRIQIHLRVFKKKGLGWKIQKFSFNFLQVQLCGKNKRKKRKYVHCKIVAVRQKAEDNQAYYGTVVTCMTFAFDDTPSMPSIVLWAFQLKSSVLYV